MGGRPSPHHVKQVHPDNWSAAAKAAFNANPNQKPRDYLRVEHGTPRRGFARKVLELYATGNLTEATMDDLTRRYWKLAVITVEEDARLAKIARSTVYETPDARWSDAGILFDPSVSLISNRDTTQMGVLDSQVRWPEKR